MIRGLAGSCAISIEAVVAVAKKMKVNKQSTRALTVSFGMSRRARGGNGASVPQAVGSFPSENVTQAEDNLLTSPNTTELAKQ